jgi:hypothetical protein
MLRRTLSALGVVLMLVLAIRPGVASAHQTIQVGDYDVEYGWVNEPVIVNQPNAVVINITPHAASANITGTVSLLSPAGGAGVQGDHTDVRLQFAGLSDSAAAKINVSGASDAGTAKVSGGIAGMSMGAAPTQAAPENIDVSGLKIEAVYGAETKTLTLQPLGENTPGQFVAPLLPTRQGQITIRLSGKIGKTDIKTVEVQPEEVQGVDAVAFPKVVATPASSRLSASGWLGLGGLVFGIIGTLLGAVALMRRK